MPVAIVVNPSCARTQFLGSPEAGSLGHIGKSAVPVVMEKMILAVGSHKKIVMTIVVVIDESDSRPKCLRKVFLPERTVVMGESDTSSASDIREVDLAL